MNNMKMVLQIDSRTALPAEAGGKARGLQLIAKAGLRTPPAWILLPDEPESTKAALADELRRQGFHLLAVRSSAPDEDADHHSFAGIHESRLAITVDDLTNAIGRVSASALSARACNYRKEVGLPAASGPCAVIIQKMVASEYAGIAFGEGPTKEVVLIEAVEGLGETVVDGRVTPETLILRRHENRWQIDQRMPRWQLVISRIQDGRVLREELSPNQQQSNIINDSLASQIGEGVAHLERLAGKPLDVEWAFADDILWFLQARPQTRPLHDGLPAGEIWTRVNTREVLPEIPSAFSRSVLIAPLDAAERTTLQSYGIRTDPSVPFAALVYGRPVFNERIYLPADLLGLCREFIQAEFGGCEIADAAIGSLDFKRALQHPNILLRTLLTAARAEHRATRFLELLPEVRQKIVAINSETVTDQELLDTLANVHDSVIQPLVLNAISVATAVGNAQYKVLRQLRHHPSPWALLARLVAEGKPSVSTQQIDDLVALAKILYASSGVSAFIKTVTPNHELHQYWQNSLPSHIWKEVQSWLEKYGHRGPFESDLAQPRYQDDLRLLGRALFPLISGKALSLSSARYERRQAEAEKTWAEVENLCNPLGRWQIKKGVRQVKRLMALRERLRSEAMRVIAPLRYLVLDLGRRFEQSNRLESHHDIWNLSFDEIKRAIFDSEFAIQVAVAKERARLAAWRRIQVPNRFTSEEVPFLALQSFSIPNAPPILRGDGISPGIAEGRISVLRSPSEGQRFPSGSVLVAPATDPAWTPIFARAVGIVVELGGALSHAGIVAREFGIPCVANIRGLTSLLQNGDLVRLDGTSGLVTILSRARELSDQQKVADRSNP